MSSNIDAKESLGEDENKTQEDLDEEETGNKKDSGQGEEHDGAPIDRGWAWVVLAERAARVSIVKDSTVSSNFGYRMNYERDPIARAFARCVFEIVVYGGMMRSFGFFFLQYQYRFGSSASETAVMNMIQNLVISFAALFVMTIGMKKFSSRVAAFIGGIFTATGYLITTFTKDLGVFYFAQGILCGAGMAFTHPPMLAIIGVYFKKHRGLANSIFTAGGSFGGLIFAPVVVKLFEEYQYTGAMLIISGLLMNILPAALLMRPIEFYTKKKQQSTNKRKLLLDDAVEQNEDVVFVDEATQCETAKSTSVALLSHLNHNETLCQTEEDELLGNGTEDIIYKKTEVHRLLSHDPRADLQNYKGSPLLQRARAHSFGNRQRTTSERSCSSSEQNFQSNKVKDFISAVSHSQMALSGEGICGSFIDVNTIPPPPPGGIAEQHLENNTTELDQDSEKNRGCSTMKTCLLSVLCTVFDLDLLRNPIFLMFLLMAWLVMSGLALVQVFIPPYANEIGISNERIGLLLSLFAVMDLVSKITMGVIADRNWLQRPTILATACFLVGTACHLLRFVSSFALMVVFVVISGMCCGQYLSVYAVLLIEITGPEKFKSSLGFGTLVHGISIAVFFPITGLLRDRTGTYVIPLHLLGGLAYLAGILVLLIFAANKRYKTRKTRGEILLKDGVDKT